MPNGTKAVCATATLSNPVRSDTRGKFTLGPGGAAEHSPGRQPWETSSNGSPKAPSGATEPKARSPLCRPWRGSDSLQRLCIPRACALGYALSPLAGLMKLAEVPAIRAGAMLMALREHAKNRKTCPRQAVGTPPFRTLFCFAMAILTLTTPAQSQSPDSVAPKRPTEMYVPASDLDAVLGMEKRGVLLPRSQFEELLKKAEQNSRETPDIPNGITVMSADYQGRIVGSQLLLAATIKLNQVVDGWRFLRLPLNGVGLESATLDGHPALLGANGSDHTLHLFSDHRGAHTLVLEAAVPLVASGGDREANFHLGDLPVGTLNLEVAANQRLLASGHALERLARSTNRPTTLCRSADRRKSNSA